MRTVTYFKIVFLVLGLFGFAGLAWSNSLFTFPDPKTFEGIKGVVVPPITLTNMENVKVDPETLRATMKKQLDKGGIGVEIGKSFQPSDPLVERFRKDVGLLKAAIRRWETSGPLGSAMNSFTISLQFYQKARLQPSQREGWAITWSETQSVIVGTRRTKGIEDALQELLQLFILDWKGSAEPS